MAALAAGIGGLSVALGIGLSLWQDTPVGPSIVTAATIIFSMAVLFARRT
jgi:zinc transport system permease protein